MSQDVYAEAPKLQNANSSEQISSTFENNSAVGTTGLTDEERVRYEQVQAEIAAMIVLEEEKERAGSETIKKDSDDDDLLLSLLPL